MRNFQVLLLEQVGGAVRVVVVELVQQHQVRSHLLQNGGDLARVLAVTFQLPDESAVVILEQRGVVGGDAHGGLLGVAGGIAVHANLHAGGECGEQ